MNTIFIGKCNAVIRDILDAKITTELGKASGERWAHASTFCIHWADYLRKLKAASSRDKANILEQKFCGGSVLTISVFDPDFVKDEFQLTREQCCEFSEDEVDTFPLFFSALSQFFRERLQANDYYILEDIKTPPIANRNIVNLTVDDIDWGDEDSDDACDEGIERNVD